MLLCLSVVLPCLVSLSISWMISHVHVFVSFSPQPLDGQGHTSLFTLNVPMKWHLKQKQVMSSLGGYEYSRRCRTRCGGGVGVGHGSRGGA